MRTHGWGGRPPSDDAEARARIVAATKRCIDRFGPAKTNLADVAGDLGVTRQTVYRYFANIDELLTAAAMSSAEDFIERLAEQVKDLRDAVEILVEAMAWTTERLPSERYVGVLLAAGRRDTLTRGITSPTALAFARASMERFPIRWSDAGLDEAELNELAEIMLRLIETFVLDSGDPPRSAEDLRSFLRRWFGPVVAQLPVFEP
jgi:AcrR family transcriptional regulator